jgi:hypothetical protein
MTADPFRVRKAGSSGDFVDVDITGASTDNIRLAIADSFSLHGLFYLKKVTQIGPPVLHGTIVAGFHAGLWGPHEAFLVQGEKRSSLGFNPPYTILEAHSRSNILSGSRGLGSALLAGSGDCAAVSAAGA